MPADANAKTYFRVDMTPPVLRVGWQTDQSANSKDLSFRVNPENYQSNPRLGPPTTLATPLTNIAVVYNLPYQSTPARCTKICIDPTNGANARPNGAAATVTHVCASGNMLGNGVGLTTAATPAL